jgi:hypothetical protein
MAFALLKKYPVPFSVRYILKAAIMQLCSPGFPFAKYVAEIVKYNENKVKVGEIIQRHCIHH